MINCILCDKKFNYRKSKYSNDIDVFECNSIECNSTLHENFHGQILIEKQDILSFQIKVFSSKFYMISYNINFNILLYKLGIGVWNEILTIREELKINDLNNVNIERIFNKLTNLKYFI